MPWVMAAQSAAPKLVAPGVWFLEGDAHAGYCNSIVIEMKDYLILVDPSYPGRTRELIEEIPVLSKKPVKWVFDTHAHGDHSYGNALWTKAGATTLAAAGVREEMDLYEPVRWQTAMNKRDDVRATGANDVERPKMVFRGERSLCCATRRVRWTSYILDGGIRSRRWVCVAAEGEDSLHGRCCGEWAS